MIWVFIAIDGVLLLLLIILFIVTYNKLVALSKKVDEAFSTMDIYLTKRWELIPKLVDAVKGYMAHEQRTLEEIATLRGQSYDGMDHSAKIRTNTVLSNDLYHVVTVAEQYPDLKASENFLSLSRSLYQIEDEIAQARKYYNGTVRMLNTKVESFPSMVVAKIFGFRSREMYEAKEIQRGDVKVDI